MSYKNGENNINSEEELLNYINSQKIINNNNSNNKVNQANDNTLFNADSKNLNQNYPSRDKDEILDMELKNIQMLILQRSLYILKKKFEINKKELEIIYQRYKNEKFMKLKCINVDYLLELYKEIMDTTQFTMLPYLNFNELISADLMTELNEDKSKAVLKALVEFTTINVEKYNRIYFEKKMRKKKLIEESEVKKKNEEPSLEEEEYTSQVKIVKINKRGKIINTFEQMLENNKEFDVGEDIIITINEDDMSILNNKKLLYSEVIPLIIADFLQEYLKNNEYVAIVSTSNISDDQENYKLNQNVKSLFDKDIIKFYNNLNKADPNEENKEKLKNLLFELMNIENQIKIYQNLVLEKTKKGQNVKHLMNMVKKLNEQKDILQKKIDQFSTTSKNSKLSMGGNISTLNAYNSSMEKYHISENYKSSEKKLIKNSQNSKINGTLKSEKRTKYKLGSNNSNLTINSKRRSSTNNSNKGQLNSDHLMIDVYNDNISNMGLKEPLTKEEIRKNSLLEIFYFYTKQHSFLGQTPTFEDILKSDEHLDMAEFGKFCVEFKVLVKPQKIAEIFKKTALNSKKLSYDNFTETLKKLSIYANDEKKQYLMERIKIYKMKLKEINEKNKKNGIIENENENEQNKSKEKEENLSGIKSEGEAEDEEKLKQEKGENNNNENIDKKSNNQNNDNDKKSINSNKDKDDKKSLNNISENKNLGNINEENINNNNNEQNQNNNEQPKNNSINKNEQNEKDKNTHLSTNQKLYQQSKLKHQSIKKNKQKQKSKVVKAKTNTFLMMESKEELEEKISKLQQDYDKLNQKTHSQLEEEFYQYLEIDDMNSYRKKMVGYIYPFNTRNTNSRIPLESVPHSVKRDPKMQKEMHRILVQRHEEMKREKELKQMKEKKILFEKRKKQFEIDNKKIQQKMSIKNDYIQFRKKEEDYNKEKQGKITWQQIQNSDYDNFILNEKDKNKNSNLYEIFTNKSNQFEGDDGDYLENFRIKKGFNEKDNENTKTVDKRNNNMDNNAILNNNINNNMNIYESINKTEPMAPKFDINLSRISSGNNLGNNSDYDIVNSIATDK